MNTSQSRFDFAGFEFVRKADTETHESEIGKINVNGEVFIVHMIRRKGLSFAGNFLVASVFDKDEKKTLWVFPKTFVGLGLLAYAGEELVIAYVGKGQRANVEDVVPLSAIVELEPVDLCRKAALKRLTATFLGRHYTLTNNEYLAEEDTKKEARDTKERERAKAHRLALEERERKYEARRKARDEQRQKIKARPKVKVMTKEGHVRYGYPVVAEEWFSLLDGDHVVLVTSYDEKTKVATGPIETFKVSKHGGGSPRKSAAAHVIFASDFASAINGCGGASTSAPKPLRAIVMKTKEGLFEVLVYGTMDDIRAARVAGLNGGTYVTAENKKAGDGRYEVYSVRKNGIETIGLSHPV